MGADLKNVTPGCLCVILFSPPPSALTSDQGSDLMERLTKRLNLHAADLTQLSYVHEPKHPLHVHASPHCMKDN